MAEHNPIGAYAEAVNIKVEIMKRFDYVPTIWHDKPETEALMQIVINILDKEIAKAKEEL